MAIKFETITPPPAKPAENRAAAPPAPVEAPAPADAPVKAPAKKLKSRNTLKKK